jgi:hypothetical protein
MKNYSNYVNEKYMFHVTNETNKIKILKEGLKINMPYNMTIGGYWATKIYKVNPIFLSLDPLKTEKQNLLSDDDNVIFRVDVTDLELVADLPALIDFGAYRDDFDEYLYWMDDTPELLKPFDDGEYGINLDDLTNPDHLATDACIKLTKSAASLNNIPLNRIKLLSS